MAMTLNEFFERELMGGVSTGPSHKHKKEVQSNREQAGIKRPRQYVCMGREVYAMVRDVLQHKPLRQEVSNPVLREYLNTQWKLRKRSAEVLEEREKRICGCVSAVII